MSGSRHRNLLSFAQAIPRFLDGTDSPRAFLERSLEVVEAREPTVKAFVVLDVEGARKAADAASRRFRRGQPLSSVDGCVIGIKDIIETADMPTQMGSALYAGCKPRRDAACVHALRRAGAVFLGKTVTTEFAIGKPGPTRNPHDPARTPGGSSSGSAAAVGAGMVPAALGTQTQSSVLRPASFCGVYGFKPTRGILPTSGVHPLSETHDHIGIQAGSLQDIWNLHSVMAQTAINLTRTAHVEVSAIRARKPQRLLLLLGAAWSEIDEETQAAFDRFVTDTATAEIEIIRSDADATLRTIVRDFDAALNDSLDIIAVEMLWPFLSYQRSDPDKLGPRIHDLLGRGLAIGPERYREMLRTRESLRRRIMDLSSRADAFISLASSGPAPLGLENLGSRTFPAFWTYLGYPSCTLPLLEVAGMPVGIQLMGFPVGDKALMGHAAWFARRA